MNTVNRWWADMPNERFWLVVARLDEMKDVLVIPEEHSSGVAGWVSQLPAYVPRRDVVFQYDVESQAIAAWSRAKGPATRQDAARPRSGRHEGDDHSRRASWLLKLHGWRLLHTPVMAEEIARVQYDLFPELRSLEEEVGDPLYYPFAMGNPAKTHPVPGRFFKLPAVFVERFASLGAVGRETRTAEHVTTPHRAASWWAALDGFLEDRPKTARAR